MVGIIGALLNMQIRPHRRQRQCQNHYQMISTTYHLPRQHRQNFYEGTINNATETNLIRLKIYFFSFSSENSLIIFLSQKQSELFYF